MSESIWSTLFRESGAEHLSASLAGTAAPLPAADATVCCPLPAAIIEVAGPDSATFLQGQLTCHLENITPERGAPGAQCSLKGRVLATFLLGQPATGRYWLRLPADNAALTTQALAKYIVFSKATIAVADDVVVLGLYGPAASELLRAAGASCGGQHQTAAMDGGLIYQRDADGLHFECWLTTAAASALLRQLGPRLQPVAPSFWELLDIRAGEAAVDAATRDQFLPQMLNLDATGAVRFDKGCYTGQEVVARAHYRGQVKRRLRRFSCTDLPADTVTDASDSSVGTVILKAPSETGWELLAVVAGSAGAVLRAGETALRAESLPYAIKENIG
ncbi:MAG: hypothetical protein RBS88_00330 [Spongiibacteraceae bacterium]|nr:hypothetical protein [Spongiibacteraceae bacterium]